MPRKGDRKVKTGCHTCKIRKVKCDETRPHCSRCISTGRTCDGYVNSQCLPSLHEHHHLSPSHGDKNENRALEFFRSVVGPVLSNQFDNRFWTCLVLQLSHREPAIRHALVAIGSLYENLQDTPQPPYHSMENSFAVCQYNTAIQKLVLASDEVLTMFMSVLFVCVEFLQGNAQAAIDHCRHGIMLFNTASASSVWARDSLSPILSHLSIFPFFFGSSVSDFPHLAGIDSGMPPSFDKFTDGQSPLDALLNRTIRLVRQADDYRLGASRHLQVTDTLRDEQEAIEKALDEWHRIFSEFKNAYDSSDLDMIGIHALQMRYLVAKIWVNTSLEGRETAYDAHLDTFQTIVDLASEIVLLRNRAAWSPLQPKFTFEMGFLPILYFAVIKCRSFEVRLAALFHMRTLAISQESLWEANVMYYVGRRLIEIEHEIDDCNDIPTQNLSDYYDNVPLEEKRIQECMVGRDADIKFDQNGDKIFRRTVTYILRTSDDELDVKTEWIAIC